MNHHFATSWLQSLSGKLEALTSWSLSANRHGSCATHKNLFREFFSAPFQKTLALVDEQKKTEFLGVIEKNLFKFDESTQQFPLGCLCALLLHGKDSPRMQEKVVAWVDFILERLRLRGWERAAVAEVVEECLSAPFQKFLPLMEAPLRARLADGLGEHLGRLEEEEQKRVLEQLPAVPARIDEIVAGCTSELNAWLLSAPLYPATPASLADTLMRLEHPLVRLFTVVKDAAKKESFLVAVALALQGLRTRFKWMCAVELGLESVGKELQRRFFTVEGQGPVMELWLSSRLKKYNAEVAARTAGLLVAEPSKLEVLKSRLRPLFPERQGPSGDPAPAPDSEETTAEPERKALEEGWVSLDGPNAVSNAVLLWLMESYPGFFCPQHTLARETLMGVLQRCGRAFETELQGSCARARLGLSEAEPQPLPAMPKDPPPPPKQPLPAPGGALPRSLGQPLPPSLQPRPLLGGPGSAGSGVALGQVAAPGLPAPVHVPPPLTLPAASTTTTGATAAAKAIANATANAAVAGAGAAAAASSGILLAGASPAAGPSLGQAFGTLGQQPLAPWAASARPPAPSAPSSLSLAPLPPAAPLGSSKAAAASTAATIAAAAATAGSPPAAALAATVATATAAASAAAPPEVDNLIDLLLGEALEGLASEVRARIVKLGHGVYRFGSKEVTLHTQNGRLYVNRIGEVLKHVPLLTLLQEEGLLSLPPAATPGLGPAAGALALAAPSIAGAGAASTLMAAAKAATGGSAASGALSTSAAAGVAASDTSSVARIALQAKQISSGVTTTTTAALQPAPFGLNRSVTEQKSDPQALMSKRVEAATKAMDVSKQIVRRSVNFEDDKLLRRLLSKGLKHDKQWQSSYQEYCSSHGVTEHDQKLHDKDFIATFIEQNLANSINQDWAKKILWSPAEDGDKKEKKEKRGRKEEKKEKKDKTRRRDGIGNSAGKRAASGSSSGSERQALPAKAALGSVVAAPQTASALEMPVAMPMYAGMPLGMGGMLGPMGQMGGMLGPMGMPMLGDAGMQAMATEHADYHRSRKKAKKEKAEKSGKSRRN